MMDIRIYQINMERDSDHVKFSDLESARRYGGDNVPKAEIYDKVFDGEVECEDLEDVYAMFNDNRPRGFNGHSLSESDVIEVINDDGKSKFYYCDRIGFKEVDFDTDKVPVEQKMQVVLLRPGRKAEITEIGKGLEALQQIVDGDIQAVYPYEEEVCIICNDEGKLIGLPLNRALYTEPEEIEMSYAEMRDKFREQEDKHDGTHIKGYIVFSEDSFDKPYPIESRTYVVSSNNKAFQSGMGGYSIYGSSLDGTDVCVRLDGYMRCENPWKIERCYMIEDTHEMYDILPGNAIICSCAGHDFGSLTDEQAKRYAKKFESPEVFMRINGKIQAFPINEDKNRDER